MCASFAKERKLSFGTDPDPAKSKTKCTVLFPKKTQEPQTIKLGDHSLPWVDKFVHLGSITFNLTLLTRLPIQFPFCLLLFQGQDK